MRVKRLTKAKHCLANASLPLERRKWRCEWLTWSKYQSLGALRITESQNLVG